MKYIIELEENVWLADGDGDLPRTLKHENARLFSDPISAQLELNIVIETYGRPFASAEILLAQAQHHAH